MRLRTKLLIPIVGAVFAGFSAFIGVEYLLRTRSDEGKLAKEIAQLKDVIASSSVAYLWAYDTEGLAASVESLLKDEYIVEIEVTNAEGQVVAHVSEPSEPELFSAEAEVARYGSPLGKARIVFTDKPLREETTGYLSTLLMLEAAIILFISAMTFLTARIVTVPVARLSGKVKGMAEGEADLRSRLPVEGKDEVAELSRHFNEFLDKLASIMASMKDVSRESRALGERLSASAHEVSASATQISASMGSMAARTSRLNEEIAKQREGVARVDGYAERVVGLIHDQAAAVNESSAAVEQMIANVSMIDRSTEGKLKLARGLEELARGLSEKMELNVGAMEGASRSTELISEMIEVIKNVASQTNLLAMNAAIEAAHAGEYGKGFSVVADEIRKLAEQTSENVGSISESIGKVVDGIEEATELTRGSSDSLGEVIRGIADVAGGMNETMTGLKEIAIGNGQITESLSALNAMTEGVKASGAEMREGAAAIAASIKTISGIVDENARGFDEIASGASGIASSISELSSLSRENSKVIEGLDAEIGRFGTDGGGA